MISFESLERIREFVGCTRQRLLTAAQAARLNGYNQVAAEHTNEAYLAQLILQDLANEYGVVYADQNTNYKSS